MSEPTAVPDRCPECGGTGARGCGAGWHDGKPDAPSPLDQTPTLVYETSRATVWHGRAEDILPTLDRDSVDMIATDPPYGQQWQSNRRTDRLAELVGDDGTLDLNAVIGMGLRVLRRARHVYVFGPFDPAGLPLCGVAGLVWDKGKTGTGDLTCPWGPSHEPITFATYEISKANRAKGYGRLAARLRSGTVLHVPRKNSGQVGRHPTEKPVRLMRQLIESSSCLGETVLDPFAGSGSTLVAAVLAGRRAVGIECDERYIPTIDARLREAEAIADQIEDA